MKLKKFIVSIAFLIIGLALILTENTLEGLLFIGIGIFGVIWRIFSLDKIEILSKKWINLYIIIFITYFLVDISLIHKDKLNTSYIIPMIVIIIILYIYFRFGVPKLMKWMEKNKYK